MEAGAFLEAVPLAAPFDVPASAQRAEQTAETPQAMLQRLSIRDFRNFESLDAEIPSSGLVIVGENGHGKTNFLEAVSYLGLLRSFRSARDADVLRFGAAAFNIRASLSSPSRFHVVSVGYERATRRKRVSLDGVEQDRLSWALGALPSVTFAPSDVSLVAGGPGERRHYLDVMLSLSSPGYLQALQGYRAALLRRNAVLRSLQQRGADSRGDTEARIAVWEPALAENGAIVVTARKVWVAAAALRYEGLCAAIGESAVAGFRYSAGWHVGASAGTSAGTSASAPTGARAGLSSASASEQVGDTLAITAVSMTADLARHRESLTHSLARQRSAEMKRGMTLSGPHRDDLILSLGGRDLRSYGSAGQQRSAAIALRLLELFTLRDALGHAPLLLLDDPFAELDSGRAARVLALLDEAEVSQVLLTVPRESDIPAAYTRLEQRRMLRGRLS